VRREESIVEPLRGGEEGKGEGDFGMLRGGGYLGKGGGRLAGETMEEGEDALSTARDGRKEGRRAKKGGVRFSSKEGT